MTCTEKPKNWKESTHRKESCESTLLKQRECSTQLPTHYLKQIYTNPVQENTVKAQRGYDATGNKNRNSCRNGNCQLSWFLFSVVSHKLVWFVKNYTKLTTWQPLLSPITTEAQNLLSKIINHWADPYVTSQQPLGPKTAKLLQQLAPLFDCPNLRQSTKEVPDIAKMKNLCDFCVGQPQLGLRLTGGRKFELHWAGKRLLKESITCNKHLAERNFCSGRQLRGPLWGLAKSKGWAQEGLPKKGPVGRALYGEMSHLSSTEGALV